MRSSTADRTASGWSTPTLAPFSGVVPGYADSDSHVTLDGDSVIFSSNRPGTPSYPLNDLWITHRTANGWSQPVDLGSNVNSPANELYASADIHGTLYFASDRDRGQWDLYRSRLGCRTASYAPAEKLPGNVTHPTR